MAFVVHKLRRSYYLRPTLEVARDLLGKYLVRRLGRKRLVGKIVEVEAYCQNDPASHSYRGMTERNKIMFAEGGHLYVYFTYGMHFCANVVTRRKGVGEAVLIRAVEPIEGIEEMMKKRGFTADNGDDADFRELTNGPAKVCEAFGIERRFNGVDLTGNEVYIGEMKNHPKGVPLGEKEKIKIGETKRVGVVGAKERKWRFYIEGSHYISKTRRSVQRR